MALKIGSRTPWGKADHVENKADGIQQVDTPSHGGFKLSRARNAGVASAWRHEAGWYEEDCAWSIVAHTFPELFDERERAHARHTARAYYPDAYTAITGEVVPLAESHVLRERAFRTEIADKYVARAAWGDWHNQVPTGHVGVVANLGMDRHGPEAWFLVTVDDYAKGREFGLVIEPHHQRWTEHP